MVRRSYRTKAVYNVLERREVNKKLGLTKVQTIQFNSAYAKKRGVPKLRIVGYKDELTGKKYEILTNSFTLAAKTIASIYKDRWQLGLFFKAIK